MKIDLYIRLSSADSDIRTKSESDSIGNQRLLLRKFVQSKPEFSHCEIEEFVDDGYTGTNDNRPAFQRLIEDAKHGKVHVIICKDMSRFFRDYVELGDYLERIFPYLGIRFISVNDGYDSDKYKGTTGGLDIAMQAVIYSFYSRDLSAKVRAAFKNKARRGEYTAPFAPYGYMKDPKNKHVLIPDLEVMDVVRAIFDKAIDGMSMSDIARNMNASGVESPSAYFMRKHPDCGNYRSTSSKEASWSMENIRRILMNRVYIGSLVSYKAKYKNIENQAYRSLPESEWIVVDGCHEPIVAKDVFFKVQERFRKNQKYDAKKHENLLRSLIRCGVCGRAMTHVRHLRLGDAYHCMKSVYVEDTKCPVGIAFRDRDIEKAVIDVLCRMLNDLQQEDDKRESLITSSGKGLSFLKRQIIKLEEEIARMNTQKTKDYEAYADGKLSRECFLEMRRELTARLERSSAELNALKGKVNVAQDSAIPNPLMSDAQAVLAAINGGKLTNEMLKIFIDRIYLYADRPMEIVWRFKSIYPFSGTNSVPDGTDAHG